MVVDARYAVGDGVLIGAGAHWVLMSDPGDESVLNDVWEALGASPTSRTGSVTEAVLELVEKAFPQGPPAFAMVDFTSGASTATSRGAGHVHVEGAARVLSLNGSYDPEAATPRRLVSGMAGACVVDLRPIAAKVAPPPLAAEPIPVATDGLIDGIPDAILAAKGPEGPPPLRARLPVPSLRDEGPEDTGSIGDTTEPSPDLMRERIEETAHTTIRPAREPGRVPPPPPSSLGTGDDSAPAPDSTEPAGPSTEEVDDHDGATIHRPAHLTGDTGPTVLAVSCPLGHHTPPALPQCRVCHQRVAPQDPIRVPRPTLGGLRLPTGEVVPLDRGVVLGRKPAPVDGSNDWPHLVHLPSGHSFVSRMHLQIEIDGWDVLARDLNSRGGSTIALPGRAAVRMNPGEAYVLEPGTTVDLAEVYAVRFETGRMVDR